MSVSVPNVVVRVNVPPVKTNLYQMSFIPSPPPMPHDGLVPSAMVFRLLVATAGAFGRFHVESEKRGYRGLATPVVEQRHLSSHLLWVGRKSRLKKEVFAIG